MRPDDPGAVMAHAGRYAGGCALIVLGGPSGANWKRIRNQVKPDVILTANGNTDHPGAEYWMLSENMHYQWGQAEKGDRRGQQFVRMLNAPNTARYRLVSHHSWDLLESHKDCIRIRRWGRELSQFGDFSLRDYGEGYLWGWMMKHIEALHHKVNTHVGTVAMQLIHQAGILGCAQAHTIGFDLMFRGDDHHWYRHPHYQPDRFCNQNMFITRKYGDQTVHTRWDMVEAAQCLKALERMDIFTRDGLTWRDHSEGLLRLEGLQCTQS